MEMLLVEDKSVNLRGRGAASEAFIPNVAYPATDEVPLGKHLQKVKARGTILFVEDEASIREMTTMYLEALGYRVIEASDSTTAVMLWGKHDREIDLVLTDLVMPGALTGHRLVERLRADRPDLKAILVSGYHSESFGEGTFLGETTNFLQKPYRLKNLSDMVHDCLGRSEAA